MNESTRNVKQSVKHWYLTLIVGLILIGVGVWTLFSPANSYIALSIIFSLSFLFAGLFEVVFAISNRKIVKNWGWSLALGALTLLLGIMLISNPEISLITLPLYVGFMLLFRSFSAVGMALDLKNYGVLEWGNLMVIGVLGILFAFMLIWNPFFAGITVVIWTGLAFLSSGIFSIYLSLKMRKLYKSVENNID